MTEAAHRRLIYTRQVARRLALQALYQWELSGMPASEILGQFREDMDFPKADGPYFAELLTQIIARVEEIDTYLASYLERRPELIDPIERALLRIACYELLVRQDIPYRVIINEAVALAKRFGAEQSHRFVNGVLDRLRLDLRAAESPASA